MEKINSNRLKLFFCINDLRRGGAEKQLNYLSNYLCAHHDIYIFTFSKKKIEYKFNKKIKIYQMNKIFFFYRFLIEVLVLKPKIVFFMLPKSYFLFGTLMILFPKIKKILLRRSLNYYHSNFFYKYYEFFLHKFTHLFICNSYAAKNDLIIKENVPKNKIEVISNYIKFSKKEIKSKKKIKSTKFKILCISNFHKYKGHLLILKTLSYLKNFPITVYFFGQNKDLTKKELIEASKKLNIYNKVNFIKKIDQSFCFPNFSLGISFSKTESFPNSILEYFTFGLPVLAYDTGDIKRLVNGKNGKIFKNRNPKVLSQIIKNLFYDKKLKSKSQNSFHMLKIFSDKKNTLNKYSKIIDKIICVE